jgi:AcrR family transcriptional regulator
MPKRITTSYGPIPESIGSAWRGSRVRRRINRTTVQLDCRPVMARTRPIEPPKLTDPPRERADAARNRALIVDAARSLFADQGVAGVTMEQVARTAGVGKGTVFHRFGDRAGLAVALLDDGERRLQDAMLHGPPPLGPGAPDRERLLAFVEALVGYTLNNAELLMAAGSGRGGGRHGTGAYAAWHQHVTDLLADTPPHVDAGLLAHHLLSALAPDALVRVRESGVGERRLRRSLAEFVARLTAR